MEIRAGAHTRESIHAYNELSNFFRRVDRIIVPSVRDFEKAGGIIAGLQSIIRASKDMTSRNLHL